MTSAYQIHDSRDGKAAFSITTPTTGRRFVGVILICISSGLLYAWSTGNMTFNQPGPAGPIALGVMAAVMILGGVALILFQSGLTMDRREAAGGHGGQVTKWWGLGSRWSEKTYPIAHFDSVWITKEVRRSGGKNNSSKTVYPVRLRGAEEVTIREPTQPLQARQLAEQVARHAQLPLHNAAAGGVVVRQPHQLDWCLRDFAREAGQPIEEPTLPADTRLSVQRVADNRWTVEAPAIGLMRSGAPLLLVMLPAVAFFGVFVGPAIADAPPMFIAIFLTIGLAPFLVMGGLLISRGLRSTTLEISPQSVSIRERWPLGVLQGEIACDEIEEIAIKPNRSGNPLAGLVASGGIILLTDFEIRHIAAGLEHQDSRYLADLIRYTACQ